MLNAITGWIFGDIEHLEKEAWRAACQFLSQYKAWEYFDTCSRYQCAKHLIENNFTPEDI